MESVELTVMDSLKKTLTEALQFKPISASIGELKICLEYVNNRITNIEEEEKPNGNWCPRCGSALYREEDSYYRYWSCINSRCEYSGMAKR